MSSGWVNTAAVVHRDASSHPDYAVRALRIVVQIDASPYAGAAHAAAVDSPDNELLAVASAPDFLSLLVDLAPEVLYELGIGPAVRLAASGEERSVSQLEGVATACWRAITRP